MPLSPAVAVIDIGSNSIKLLVAVRGPDGGLSALQHRTLDVRISAGLGRTAPALSESGMERGLAAVQTLLADAAAFAPARTVLVATSAVRDAGNGALFCARLRAATGQTVRILSGDEEARLIGRGLNCDPALRALADFYVFDLGGGSLECLAFSGRAIAQAASLPLGCVRLMETFVADPDGPFVAAAATAIAAHVAAVVGTAGFSFSLPAGVPAIGTGGTLTTVRMVLAARAGRSLEQTDPRLALGELRGLLAGLGARSLAERRRVPGLPPARADVFPTALATVIALAEIGGFDGYLNSLYNLRWGLAAEALAG